MPILSDAKNGLGEVFLSGFSGLELEASTVDFFRSARIGGSILFASNYENPGQVAELINQIQECRDSSGQALWIAVDQEGGRVQRFKKPFTRIPEAGVVGRSGSPKLAFEIAEVMAKELKAVGVNVNFAPVADINTNPKNPVIGARAYGSTEDEVSKMVTAVVRGHLTQGIQPCVKHFPGHGDTHTDSHFALPKIDTELDVLREREFKPFLKAFKSRCQMVMTAHVVNSKLDPARPSTFSSKALREILREEMRFRGVIFSDDMEMKAVTEHFGVEDAPRLALEAGCDILCYRSEAATRVAYEALMRALDGGKLKPEIVLEAVGRSRALKKEVLGRYEPVIVAELGQKIGLLESAEVLQRLEKSDAK